MMHFEHVCMKHISEIHIQPIMQALDSDFTEENRQKCAEAARPLINAVDELTTFALSPEFASRPAKISAQVKCWKSRSCQSRSSSYVVIPSLVALRFTYDMVGPLRYFSVFFFVGHFFFFFSFQLSSDCHCFVISLQFFVCLLSSHCFSHYLQELNPSLPVASDWA